MEIDSLKRIAIKCLSFLLGMSVINAISGGCPAAAYGDNVISNPFAASRTQFDINLDGQENIKDMVRLKKYISGMPVTADLSLFKEIGDQTLPFDAEPITGWNRLGNSWQTVTSSLVAPLLKTQENGILAKSANGTVCEMPDDNSVYCSANANNEIYVSLELNEPIRTAGDDGILFYLRTDAANTVLPILCVSDPQITSYLPDMALKIGKSYECLPVGAAKWQSCITEKSGHPDRSDYFGVISFSKAFEGYIKIPYASLSNDAAVVSSLDENNFIRRIVCKFRGLGGEYGNAVFGPFFTYKAGENDRIVGGASCAAVMISIRHRLLGTEGSQGK